MITADLSGRTALVTGAASGIGLATVEILAKCGARVALNHLEGDTRGADAIARLRADGLDVIAAPGNVGKAGEAEVMVSEAIGKLGGLDFLVNNAGTTQTVEPIPFPELDRMTEDFWDVILTTNLVGPFRCAHAAASALKASKGAIVNTASVAGLGIRGSSIAYAASKAGLVNLTRSLARALAPDVRVNAVAPGFVQTPLTSSWPDSRRQATLERTLLNRLATPADIADGILYLCAGANYMTGHTIVLDGGAV